MKPNIYHIPVCPFSQRMEILLELKGRRQDVEFVVVDITQPRPDWLLQYFEDVLPERPIAQRDPYRRAVENMLTRMEGDFCNQGYGWAETVFTPFFMRFWFLEYYEGFQLPQATRYSRVQRWVDACLAHASVAARRQVRARRERPRTGPAAAIAARISAIP